MPVIDDKVVAMSFESSKFESGVGKTIGALDKLKESLKFPDAGKGLDGINDAAKRIDLSHISRALGEIKDRLGVFRLTAIAIFAEVAQKALAAGTQFVKAFTLQPLVAGFKEYSTNLNAVQTILANTQASGATLEDVNGALLDLNKYSDKTIYNFGQMARNIGTFTAAGVDLDTSTQAIKGIANLAALSGSNADQASTAMYQLSQAISAGRVGLQDWNSVVNAGMGGTVFQRALATTAENMGKLHKGTLKLVGPMKNVQINGESFRQSMQAGPGKQSWLTSDVLTETLKQFTGDLSNAQLKAKGFNDEQIKSIQLTAKTAQHAATEVKTISQVFDVAKETAGSGWAQTFQIIFGNFGEAKKTFTDLSNAINGFININAAARNKILGDWKALGGRTILIDGIRIAFHNLGLILQPIKEAFRDIFPAKTGKDLLEFTLDLRDLAHRLKPSQETVDNLKRTFRGLFAILDIGKQIVGGIFTVFRTLFGAMGTGSGSFLNFTGNIGDFLVSVDKALKKGDALQKWFERLGEILATPIELIGKLHEALSNLFDKFSPGGFSDKMDGVTKALTPFQKVVEVVSGIWDHFVESVKKSGDILQPAFDAVVSFIQNLGSSIGDASTNMNFDAILQVIRTGFFGALVVMFKQFLGKGSLLQQIGGSGGGIFKNISGTFEALNGSMKAMQQSLKAKTLKDIAIAIGILAVAVLALSFVDPERLKSSLTAITVMFGQLLGAMAILEKIGTSKGFIKMPLITAAMIAFAAAIDILAIAVIALSRLDWKELAKGLGGVAALMVILTKAVKPLSANAPGMITAGIGITAIAVAMKIMASALKDLGAMDLKTLGKGLGSVAIALGVIGKTMKLMPTANMIATGVGLVAIAGALKLMVGSIAKLGALNLQTTGKGLLGVGGAIAVIGRAMQLMPKNMPILAAGLLLVSVALGKIVDAVARMAAMSLHKIERGLIGLGGALLILALGLDAMSESLAGAAALTVAAAGISMLVPALVTLSKMSWTKIIKSLGALAAAFVVLGASAALLSPVIPAMLGMGAALILIGTGVALAGAGIFLISSGLSALAVAGPAGVGILIAALKDLSKAIPDMAKNLVLGLLEIVDQLAKTAPKFVEALAKILDTLLDVIIKESPKIAKAFGALLDAALKIIHDNLPKLVQAGFDIVLSLLKGIRNNIGPIVNAVVDIIANFVNAIANNLHRIVDAGVNLVVQLLKGVANGIVRISGAVLDIITAFVNAVANNYARIVTAGFTVLTKFLNGIADHIQDVIRAGTNLVVKLLEGVGNAGIDFITAARKVAVKFVNALGAQVILLADGFATAIIKFLNATAKLIDQREPEFIGAFANIGKAIVTGLIKGLGAEAKHLKDKIEDVIGFLPKRSKEVLQQKSPSKVFEDIGKNIVLGLANGMTDHYQLIKSATAMSNIVITSVEDTFKISSPSKVMYEIGLFVGQGFAEGLRGSTSDVESAFGALDTKMSEAIDAIREKITRENVTITAMINSAKPDQTEISRREAVVYKQYQNILDLTNARKKLVKGFDEEKMGLALLGEAYDKLADRIQDAKDKLKEKIQLRDDAFASYTSQFSALPDILKEDSEGKAVDQLAVYLDALKNQTSAVGAYKATLDQLRKLGLDDATYQKLLSEGTADQQFATQLLSGGKTAVQALNTLDLQLKTVSQTLATNASNNLYQAGVTSAESFVKGLESKQKRLHNAILVIAQEIITTLKKELHIKSPSKVFMEIGQDSMAGLAQGFSNSSQMVTSAVNDAGQNALTAMKKTMRDISGIVNDELTTNPVITPILDLTQVQNQSRALDTLMAKVPVTATASLGQASIISAEQNAAQTEETPAASVAPTINYEQNNYSPEALTEIEIYRQTRNQLSQLKSVLAPT